MHTIELKKFISNVQEEFSDLILKIKSSLDLWLAFLTRHDLLKIVQLPQELSRNSVEKALHVIDVMNFSDEEQEAYEGQLKWLRIEANTLKKAEAKGFTEGEAKGFVEGEANGALKTSSNIAIAMLKTGMDVELIAKLTGLLQDEINGTRN